MICADASVAAKWILPEQHTPLARALLASARRSGEQIVAPPLLPFEVANIIRKRMTREALPLAVADQRLAGFLTLPITLTAPHGLYRRALALAAAHNLPAVYDAHYVVVAQHYGCDLWTDDQRLLRAVADVLPFVKWIGAYPAPATP